MDHQLEGGTSTPSKNAEVLKVSYEGMTFISSDEAKEFYIDYGRHTGFSIVTVMDFVCSHEGKKREKGIIDGIDGLTRNCNTIVNGYEAHTRVLYNELKEWVVTKFSDDHNHHLVTPSKRMHLRCNRYMLEQPRW